jgi:EpsI family protein
LTILIVLLSLTALLVRGHAGRDGDVTAKEPLRQACAEMRTWRLVANNALDARIADELNLDDYLFSTFGKGRVLINLYIGYYRTAGKVGAAHDPLVCFQGQGWRIDGQESGEYMLAGNRNLKISYSSMIAERQDERQLVIYWFQGNGKAVATTSVQKLVTLLDKLSGKGEENAFVRISAPIGDDSREAVQQRLFDFIEEFYPGFHRYVTRT